MKIVDFNETIWVKVAKQIAEKYIYLVAGTDYYIDARSYFKIILGIDIESAREFQGNLIVRTTEAITLDKLMALDTETVIRSFSCYGYEDYSGLQLEIPCEVFSGENVIMAKQ